MRGEPGICAQFVIRSATRSWSCARVRFATGLARLVTRQIALIASGVNTSPGGSSGLSARPERPASTIPRAASAIPVPVPPPTSEKRGAWRVSRR